MVHVCYMFRQHVTALKPFIQGYLRAVGLYGYCFSKILFYAPFYEDAASLPRSQYLRGQDVPPSRVEGTGFDGRM